MNTNNYLLLGPDLDNPNYLILDPTLPYNYLLLEPADDEQLDGNVYTQFVNATNLNGLLNGIQPLITISVEDYYQNFFDINTCNTQGINQWGALLNINRTINVPNFQNVFGFDDGETPIDNQYPCNFGMGNFYDGQFTATDLSDNEYRALLRLRYAYITTNASVYNANLMMNIYVQSLNASYKAFVKEISPMIIQFQFNFNLTDLQYAALTTQDVLPIPLGVGYSILLNVDL